MKNATRLIFLFLMTAVLGYSAHACQDIVTLYGNGYVYPRTDDEGGILGKHGIIMENGLTGWDNASVFTRTFFYPGSTGSVEVAIRVRSPGGGSRISVRLDSSGKAYMIDVPRDKGYVIIPVGNFDIPTPRYHCVEIRGVSKTGKYFPDISSVVLSAAKDIQYNNKEYRGAPATHIWYQAPKDSAIAWFYNEVSVPVGVDSRNAYYETNGFAGGYMGIQVNSGTERRIIFSIWSNFNTQDPKQIPADYAVNLIKKGAGVFTGEFGNEGSGGHSHLVFPWKNGAVYKLLVGARAAGDHTIYTAYYYAPENSGWRLIACWDKAKTGGALLSSLYSFVENFGPNGDDYFKADYGNQWMCTPSGTWLEMDRCNFTTTASPANHPRFDYGAGVEDNRFYMFTGGFKDMNNLAPHSSLQRQPSGKAPDIDFSTLPEK